MLMGTWSLIRVDVRSAYGSVIKIGIQLAVFDKEKKRNKYLLGRCVITMISMPSRRYLADKTCN